MCVDNNLDKINLLNKGNIPIYAGDRVINALKRRFVFEELMPDTKALRNNFRENSVSDGENYAKILEKIKFKKTIHQFFPIDITFFVKKFLL